MIRISKPLNFVWCYTIGCSKNNSFEYWFLQLWVGLMKPILFSSLTKVSTVLLGPERRFWITKAWPRYKWVWQNWWVESPKVSSILNKLWIFFFYFFYGNYCTWVFSIIIWKYPPNISKQKNKNKNKIPIFDLEGCVLCFCYSSRNMFENKFSNVDLSTSNSKRNSILLDNYVW